MSAYDSATCAYYESGTVTCISERSEYTEEESESVTDEKSAYARLLHMYTHDGMLVCMFWAFMHFYMYVYIHVFIK